MFRHSVTRDPPRKSVTRLVGAAALAFTLLLGAHTPASAQVACAKHADLVEQLGTKHAEAPIGIGLASNGGIVQVFSSEDGVTWTIVMTMPNGISCLMAAGESWELISPELFNVKGPKV
ncbi:MAG: hypothetical protein ISR44_01495 [Rhodospirillales bacterium]|nr:hypothetical protein [Rhodospirillales bacterium]